ncbi:hypothetical protein ScPMuIL_009548 [Solemya velum]
MGANISIVLSKGSLVVEFHMYFENLDFQLDELIDEFKYASSLISFSSILDTDSLTISVKDDSGSNDDGSTSYYAIEYTEASCSMLLSHEWDEALWIQSSSLYAKLSKNVTKLVDHIIRSSSLAYYYKKSSVNGFMPSHKNSVISNFTVFLGAGIPDISLDYMIKEIKGLANELYDDILDPETITISVYIKDYVTAACSVVLYHKLDDDLLNPSSSLYAEVSHNVTDMVDHIMWSISTISQFYRGTLVNRFSDDYSLIVSFDVLLDSGVKHIPPDLIAVVRTEGYLLGYNEFMDLGTLTINFDASPEPEPETTITTTSKPTTPTEPSTNCWYDQFTCDNGNCIPDNWYCDGMDDCGDYSDEPFGCSDPTSTCEYDEFTCDNSKCIPRSWLCDYYDDCGDNSDEPPDCHDTTTTPKPATTTEPSVKIRLAGSDWHKAGRVEIYHEGYWGTVCADRWSDNDAKVVCRQLGYGTDDVTALPGGYFGPGYGRRIWLDNVECAGDEEKLEDCQHNPWGDHDCTHEDDAAVSCDSLMMTTAAPTANDSTTKAGNTATEGTSTLSPEYHKVRLVDGLTCADGRVEIYHNGQWGTICSGLRSIAVARTVCKMLGLRGGTSLDPEDVVDGNYGQPIWLELIYCGNEIDSIVDCEHNNFGSNYCSHSSDLGVLCEDSIWDCPLEEKTVNCTFDNNTCGYKKEKEGWKNFEWSGYKLPSLPKSDHTSSRTTGNTE